MQSTPSHLRWSLRSCIVLTLLVVALIEGAMQLAHWYASHAGIQTAQIFEGTCSTLPAGDGSAFEVVCL